MHTTPALRRWIVGTSTVAVFAVVAVVAMQNSSGARPGDERGPQAPDKKAPADTKKADARQWPLWGGTVGRNLVNLAEKNVPDDWSNFKGKEKNIKWAIDLGSKAYGGPIFAGGRIFVGTNNDNPRVKDKAKGLIDDAGRPIDHGVMMCFEEATGKFLWQLAFPKLAAGRVNDWPREGICSAPVVEGDRIWFVSNRCEVVCARAADGEILWKLDMIGKYNVFPHNLATCSPLIVGDTLFVITSNGVDEGHINIPQPAAPSFLALNKENGDMKWSSNLPSINLIEARKKNPNIKIKELIDRGELLMHGQWSNPVYTETKGTKQIIFPGGDGWMYAFNPPDGKLLWRFDCNPKSAEYVLGPKGTRNDFVSTPVVWEDKLYIGVGQDPEHDKGVGHLWCIDLVKAIEKGKTNAGNDVSPREDNFDPMAAVNKDSALVWHFGGPTKEGDDYERNYYFGRTLSACAVHDGLLYTGEYDGVVHCLDAKTGKQYWEHDMHNDTWASPYWVDGKVYVGNEGSNIQIFAHGKEKKLLRTVKFEGRSKIRATPVVVNGVLYVITENPCRLYAIQ